MLVVVVAKHDVAFRTTVGWRRVAFVIKVVWYVHRVEAATPNLSWCGCRHCYGREYLSRHGVNSSKRRRTVRGRCNVMAFFQQHKVKYNRVLKQLDDRCCHRTKYKEVMHDLLTHVGWAYNYLSTPGAAISNSRYDYKFRTWTFPTQSIMWRVVLPPTYEPGLPVRTDNSEMWYRRFVTERRRVAKQRRLLCNLCVTFEHLANAYTALLYRPPARAGPGYDYAHTDYESFSLHV